jgi:DNA-directed RNA polymerase subunit RPC12/RpoP
MIVKCTECGNTFQRERIADGEVVTCPICDASYRATVKDGKVEFQDFLFEEDLGEL